MLVGMSQVNFWRSIYLLDATLALASFKLSNHIILSTMHFRSCLSFGGLAEQLQELQNCSEPIGQGIRFEIQQLFSRVQLDFSRIHNFFNCFISSTNIDNNVIRRGGKPEHRLYIQREFTGYCYKN